MRTDCINQSTRSGSSNSMNKLDESSYQNAAFHQLLEKKKAAVSDSTNKASTKSVENKDNQDEKKEKEDELPVAFLTSDSSLIDNKTTAVAQPLSKMVAKAKRAPIEVTEEKWPAMVRTVIHKTKTYTNEHVKMGTLNFNAITTVENDRQLLRLTLSANEENQLIMPSLSHFLREMPMATLPSGMLQSAVGCQQWQAELGQQLLFFNRNNIQQAELRLHPEELGSLHIQLAMHDGKMHLDMFTIQQSVKGILESAIPDLRISLAEQGIELLAATINGGDTMQFGGNHASKYANTILKKSLPSSEAKLDSQCDALSLTNRSAISIFV